MSFWKKKDNLIITGLVAAFCIGVVYWSDFCCLKAAHDTSSPNLFQVPFIDANQKQLTLHEFKGKPLIINFWATWCPVCVKNMGTLNTFAKDFEKQGGKVITLSEDTSIEVIQGYYTRNGYQNLPIYLDSGGQLMTAFGIRGLPTSIFIDAKGNEVDRIVGGVDWSTSSIHDLVFHYLGIRVPLVTSF